MAGKSFSVQVDTIKNGRGVQRPDLNIILLVTNNGIQFEGLALARDEIAPVISALRKWLKDNPKRKGQRHEP